MFTHIYKHLYDRMISLRYEVWTHTTSFIPPLFHEWPVPSKKSERLCNCVLEVSNVPLSTILRFEFGIVATAKSNLFSSYSHKIGHCVAVHDF